MSTIAIFFNDPAADGYPLRETEYAASYRELHEELRRRGARMVMVRSQKTYMHGNAFRGGWEFSDTGLERIDGIIDADIIYNKGSLIADAESRVINHPDLDELCIQKWRTYDRFPAFSPRTAVVRTADELARACAGMHGDMVVAKPLASHGGKGVIIAPAGEIAASVSMFPYLVQEFIDTSNGIPGITDGRHDFRIVSICGKIVQVYFRSPPEDGYVANLSRGATLHMLEPTDIPAGAMDMFRAIDAELSVYPERVYSVDMGLNRDGRWILIELNSQPGLRRRSYGESAARFQEELAGLLIRASRK